MKKYHADFLSKVGPLWRLLSGAISDIQKIYARVYAFQIYTA